METITHPRSSASRLSGYFWLTIILFAVFVATFVVYVQAEKRIDHAHELRQQSFLLADELRQSSDDLTRMVRTYAVTGDPIYRQHYQEILDIRDGRKPRPAEYQNVYWDLVGQNDRRPRPAEAPVPLLEQMRQAGFTAEEFTKLAEAKANSDALTRTEFAAMALVESAQPPSAAIHAEAVRMLHDAAYHAAKAEIMRPIGEFNRMADRRTLAAVHNAETDAALARLVFVLFVLVLVFLLWRAQQNLHAVLGGSANEVYRRIASLGSGNFSAAIPVPAGRKNSVLGWLSETQIKLARIDAERKQAEATAKASEQRFRDIVDTTDGIVWEADATTFQFSFVSQKAERLLGYALDDWMQPGFWVGHLHPDDKLWAAEYCASCARRMEPHEFEYRFIARDGSTVWLHDLVTVVATDDATRWLRGIMVDVTGRKQAEAALRESESEIRKLNEELDARVKARTAELESAVADLEGFSYSVSHDLRAPLRAIDGFSSIIREDYAPALDDAGKELFQGIRRNAQRMGELIDDILVFSRVGRHEMQTRSLDMKALATTVWLELAAQRSGRDIEFRLHDLPAGIGDQTAVQQVLENLLSNAIKFSHGREHARIEVGGKISGTESVYFVKDNGIGFNADYAAKLFGLFQRLHGVKDFEGTGVGLAIVKRFVVKLGGRVWAEGQPGQGATFWFSLPAADAAGPAGEPAQDTTPAEAS